MKRWHVESMLSCKRVPVDVPAVVIVTLAVFMMLLPIAYGVALSLAVTL